MNDIEIIDRDIVDMTERPQGGGLLDSTTDNILALAQKADQYIEAMNKIMTAALKITNELDWCLIGGTPYLQESGATKVARLFGISWQIIGKPEVTCDPQGYKTYTYKARFYLNNQSIEAEGSRSMKDEFFTGKQKDRDGNPLQFKKPDEIDERDVRLAAYTNCINNGVKRLIPGLRNIDISVLENAGFDVGKIRGYVFKEGSKGGKGSKAENSGVVCSKCGKAITQAVASFSQSKFGEHLCIDCQKGAAQ